MNQSRVELEIQLKAKRMQSDSSRSFLGAEYSSKQKSMKNEKI